MNTLQELESRLRKEGPAYFWHCKSSSPSKDQIEIHATCQGHPVPHTPIYVDAGMLDRFGLDSAAWLICHELSPNRSGVDWDRLAEI